MQECSIVEPQTVYALEKTGIWGEAVRQRRPIVVNDFQASHPLKKGYPEGHVELYKFLTAPVFSGDTIVSVIGVANKETDYDESDVRQLSLLMDAVWKVTERKRAEEKLKDYADRLEEMVAEKIHELEEERARAIQMDKLASLGEMAAGIAHELRQPLTAIQFEADYLKMVGSKALDEHAGDLNAILDGAALRELGASVAGDLARCGQLIDHLRDFGRISQDDPVPISLNRPIEESF